MDQSFTRRVISSVDSVLARRVLTGHVSLNRKSQNHSMIETEFWDFPIEGHRHWKNGTLARRKLLQEYVQGFQVPVFYVLHQRLLTRGRHARAQRKIEPNEWLGQSLRGKKPLA